MDVAKTMAIVKKDMRHVAEMLVSASEDADALDEMNIMIQSARQMLQHDAALIGEAMQKQTFDPGTPG